MMCTSFQAKYKVLDKIGEGSFSEVLRCQERQTGVLYAAKRLKKIYQNVNEILESPEVMAMRKISRHPNVLYMLESHYDQLPGRVTLIFELMEMSLYDLMRKRKGRPMTETRVKHFVYQLLKGLDHLHKHGVFHRDIKPENILLKGSSVKIGDLGSIRGVYGMPPYTEYISTRWYRSPECLLTGGFYGPKMDIWAAGCVFYELLTLDPLFPGENEVDQIAKIHNILGTPNARLVAKFRRISSSNRQRSGDFYFPVREGRGLASLLPQLSRAGLEALEFMLIYDPENRADARKLIEHRYFADLRERESIRQTRSTVSSSILANNSAQPRHPMVLTYISSERHRRLRLLNACQSQLRCADALKPSARPVESTPNCVRPAPDPRSSSSLFSRAAAVVGRAEPNKIPEPVRQRLEELSCTQVGRYLLRKRQSLQSNRLNAHSKKWYDTKLTSLRYSDKKNCQRENVGRTANNRQSDLRVCQSFYLHEDYSVRTDNVNSGKNQLPSIFLKPNSNLIYYTDNPAYVLGDSSYKINLASMRERAFQGPVRKTSTIRSPMKKIARHEISNNYYLRSASFDPKKLIFKKS